MKRAIRMDEKDNVATALNDIAEGDEITIDGQEMVARQSIPFGHKTAVVPINRGEEVIKYGEVIGRATADIQKGEHVHVHNTESLRGRGDLSKE